MRTKRNTYLTACTLLLGLLLSGGGSLAHEHDGTPESEAAEVGLLEQIRSEQNSYYRQLQENIANGIPVDVAGGSCKYIAGIFQPPPAKVVTLTFDDGPSSLTPEVLNILKRYGVKATFFVLGKEAAKYPSYVQRMVSEGHLVASHSWGHPNFHAISEGRQISELTTSDAVLSPVMPASLKLFRYPYGNSTCFTNAKAKELGYRGIVGWHIDSCDWAFAKAGWVTAKQAYDCGVSPDNIARFTDHVVSAVKRRNGGIILVHEIHKRTVQSLEEIIVRLMDEGFTFSNLDEPIMRPYIK